MTTALLEAFEAMNQPGRSGAAWLEQLRQAGIERYRTSGLPTSRMEDWRFTNVAPIAALDFRLAQGDPRRLSAESIRPYLYPLSGASTLVFVNGRLVPALSTLVPRPAGVTVTNLAPALATDGVWLADHLGRYARSEDSGFTALNTAFLEDGLLVDVAAGQDAGAPIHVVFASDPSIAGATSHPRVFIRLGAGARASVIESYVGLSDMNYLTNAVTEAVVAEGARLELVRIQRESEQAYHVGTTRIHQAGQSEAHSYAVTFGGLISRHNLDLIHEGPGVQGQMLGLYMGRDRQEIDNHTSILHAHPDGATREVYKGILDGRSHGVFNGKIYVTPIAQKTDAKQTNRVLLLSDQARIDTKPQLEIFADDVKCTHGATVGSLDPVASFYLRSRGVGATQARKILTYAFAAEVLEEIPFDSIRVALEAIVMERLETRRGA